MSIRKLLSGIALVVALSVSAPAFAHEDHDKQAAARAQAAAPAGAVPEGGVMAMPGMAMDMDHGAMTADEGPKPMPQRLYR
ncbi:MAG TPA: hypothetical protein DDY79_00305, partial [Brevundimonas sp.]|nr:hypothetical protein [Brevundimonas sp.]